MAFADEKPPPAEPQALSKIDRALAGLTESEREAADAWLRSGGSFPTIVAKFKAEGISTSVSGVARWRAAQGLPGRRP